MKKILALFILFFATCIYAEARIVKDSYAAIIRESNIDKSSVAISIKNVDSGRIVYSLNDKILMHPASVQKILTIVPISETLGADYELKTQLYKRGENGYLIKLGADPYLKTDDLESLIGKIQAEKIKNMYIDDSIIERKDWGEGWQWDDDLNTYTPRFNAYNLDGNLFKITVMPTELNKQALIINPQKSPMIVYNNVITGDENNIRFYRDNITSADTLKLEGTIKTPETYTINNNNLKRYFEKKLTDALENRHIYLKTAYSIAKTSDADVKVAEVSHPISFAVQDILLNSSNLAIETLGKIAGGKYYKKQGTDIDGLNLFNVYCEKNGLDNSRIRLVDFSGVSKNNLVNTDFISEYLVKNRNNSVLQNMAAPGQGTLSNRMLPLQNNLRAKTGTLSDISSIAGFITAKSGKKYAFSIIINDPSTNNSQKKNLEDYLVRNMYLKL